MPLPSSQKALLSLLLFLIGIQGLVPSISEKPAQAAKAGVIVAFGDSLTAGLGVSSEQAYPALLEKTLKKHGYAFKVINSGLSGETTAGGLRRVAWVLKMNPDIVILELGANDGLRGLNLGEMKKNLTQIIETLQSEKVEVVLAGMKVPPNYGKAYSEQFEAVYSALAAQYALPFIPFFLEGVAANPKLNQADGLHPTAKGYETLVRKIWPIIEETLHNDLKK